MKIPLFFDTHALMTLWNNDDGAEIIQNLIREIDDKKREGNISVVTLSEVYYLTQRRLDETTAYNLIERIMHSSLNIISISPEIAIEAGKMKRRDIWLADTLIAASAKHLNATIVSGDPHFQSLGVDILIYP